MSKLGLLICGLVLAWLTGCASLQSFIQPTGAAPAGGTVYFSHAQEKWRDPVVEADSNAPVKQLNNGREPRSKKIKTKETIENIIYFDNDSFEPSIRELEKLRILAARIQNVECKIKITGHSDSKHSYHYNQILSVYRAERVRDYLIALGVSECDMTVGAKSYDEPVADNQSEEGRAANRRVVIEVEYTTESKYENQQPGR